MLRLFVLFALLFQGYLAQAHFHDDAWAGEAHHERSLRALEQAGAPIVRTPAGQRSTEDHDGACLLCQGLALGAHALAPAEAGAPPLSAALPVRLIAHVDAPAGAPDHSWQSRAPPSA